MQLLCVWCALVNHMSMTDSYFIDDTIAAEHYVPYVAHVARSSSCCGCCVCRPIPRTGKDEYVARSGCLHG